MRRSKVRRLYHEACADYSRGIEDSVRYAGRDRAASLHRASLEHGPQTIAYNAGWNDARANVIANGPISLDAWVEVLALESKRDAFKGMRYVGSGH